MSKGVFGNLPDNYRPADPARTRSCGHCKFYTWPAMCSMWHDLVSQGSVCDSWVTRKKKGFTSKYG